MKKIILLLMLISLFSCKKEKEQDVTKITFLNPETNNELNDTISYFTGETIKFKVHLENKDGMASIKYNFEVVDVIDNVVTDGSLGGKKDHEFVVEYVVPSDFAGRILKFKFKITDNNGNEVFKEMVTPIQAAELDYIGYYTPQPIDTVYNNAVYNYEYTFFSTYGVVFDELKVKQVENGGSSVLIDTKTPAQVQHGAGASYKYYGSYTPAFGPNTTNIVETSHVVTCPGDVVFEKTHTLVVINN